MLKTIKKRNGDVVPFSIEKIENAIKKAFTEVGSDERAQIARHIAELVVKELELEILVKVEYVPTVEHIQDLVEKHIMAAGFFDVAKAYIIYRFLHTKIRQDKIVEKIDKKELLVSKRSGGFEPFSSSKLSRYVGYHTVGLNDISVDVVVAQVKTEVFEGMETKDIKKSVIMVVRSLIERDPQYSFLGARLLRSSIYEEVIGHDKIDFSNLKSQNKQAFLSYVRKGVETGLFDKQILDYDLFKVADFMDIENDFLFDYLGMQTLSERYLLRDERTRVALETPQMMWLRAAIGTTFNEKKEDRNRIVGEFYWALSNLYYTPGGRTMFLAATPRPQMSSCFLSYVGDDLHQIFKTYGDNAQLMKWSGGLGSDWSSVRATGSLIKSTRVPSQGIIPFLKIANDVIVSINRSGKRRGNECVFLETWHYDIFDFLELRKNTGDERRRTHDLNTANWIPDLFMKRLEVGGDWTLFSPNEVPELHDLYGQDFEKKYAEYEAKADRGEIELWKRVKAVDLWKKMLSMLYETGHPWITFKDAANVRSPQDHVGVVHNSNLCTEITLNTSKDEIAVCNLGSLNFAKFVVNGVFDKELVARVVRVGMRMLDNVIDLNYYPVKEAEYANKRHRPVGLGVRGYQDALYMLNIPFDSEEQIRFADESMEIVSYYSILASSELALERGAYSTYKGSKWDRGLLPQDTIDLLVEERGRAIDVVRSGKLNWTPVRNHIKQHGMRNSNCMAIAPTASTANLVGCVPSIEPIYKNLYVKSNLAGDFIIINKNLVTDLKERKMWNQDICNKIKYNDGSIQNIVDIPDDLKAKYKEVFEIDPKWMIKGAAYRGKWIDQSQSLNIFYRGTSGKDISDIYTYAWQMGLKTTYYLRTLSASQVEKSTLGSTSTQTRNFEDNKMTNMVEGAVTSTIDTGGTSQSSSQVSQVIETVAPMIIPSKAVSAVSAIRIHKSDDAGVCEGCEG